MSDTLSTADIIGKKTFFLYPTQSIKNQIVAELVQNEYEVYTCDDHARLSRALKKFPDSLLFINIDNGMPEKDWEKWIGGIMTAMPELKIGIFTSNNNEELKEKYISKYNVSCGYMSLKVDMTKVAPVILEVLNSLNVKGRRKYLRATTEHETNATINVSLNGEYIKGTVNDISVVGVSCTFENDPELKKNELVKDIQIRLQTMLIKAEAVVFGSRMEGEQKIYVMIFTQRIDPDVRVKIRKYIQQNLQSKMDL